MSKPDVGVFASNIATLRWNVAILMFKLLGGICNNLRSVLRTGETDFRFFFEILRAKLDFLVQAIWQYCYGMLQY